MQRLVRTRIGPTQLEADLEDEAPRATDNKTNKKKRKKERREKREREQGREAKIETVINVETDLST